MDPITHSLAGAVISRLGFKKKAALWVLLISSVAPDLDYISRIWGADMLLRYHRGITHGILALLIAPLIIAFAFGFKKGFIYYYFIALLGYGSHLFMDLLTQYGTRILSPLDWNPYSLNILFIIDPYIIIGLLLCLIFCAFNKKSAAAVSAVAIIILISYIGGRYYLHGKTEDFLRARIDANTYKIYPLPNAFLRWWFVVKSGNEIKTGFADLFTQRIYVQDTFMLNENDPLIERSKETRAVKNFLYFANFPYPMVKKDKDKSAVVWKELAYSFMPGEHFTAKAIFNENNRILKSEFKF